MAQPDLIERDYYTVAGGKIVTLPVREAPETCWEERYMEMIGRQLLWLCPVLIVVLLAYHYNGFIIGAIIGAALVRWAAKRMGWW